MMTNPGPQGSSQGESSSAPADALLQADAHAPTGRGSSIAPIVDCPERAIGAPRPQEFDLLPEQRLEHVHVERKTPSPEALQARQRANDVLEQVRNTFDTRVVTVGEQKVIVLGWDHAAHFERREDGYHLKTLYVHKATGKEIHGITTERQTMNIPAGEHRCRQHTEGECVWERHEVAAGHTGPFDALLTYGVSTCSAASAWDEGARNVFVSHIDSKAPIPLASMVEGAGLGGHEFRAYASYSNRQSELDKFSADQPAASRVTLDQALVSRGPHDLRGSRDHRDENAPAQGHSYMGIELPRNGTSDPAYHGDFGMSLLDRPDAPAVHALTGPLHDDLRVTLIENNRDRTPDHEDAARVLNGTKKLIEGKMGFQRTWTEAIFNVQMLLADKKNQGIDSVLPKMKALMTASRATIERPAQAQQERAQLALANYIKGYDMRAAMNTFEKPIQDGFKSTAVTFRFPMNSAAFAELKRPPPTK